MARIIDCNCNHNGQDNLHGRHQRVANETTTKVPDGQIEVRCTVCHAKKVVKK